MCIKCRLAYKMMSTVDCAWCEVFLYIKCTQKKYVYIIHFYKKYLSRNLFFRF